MECLVTAWCHCGDRPAAELAFGGRRKSNVDRVALATPGAPGVGSFGGAAMRRSTMVAALGGVIALVSLAWAVLVALDIVTDKHAGGVPLARVATGAFIVGLVLFVAGLLVTRRARKAEAADEDDYDDQGEYVWPTIVVRRHGRPRHRPTARIVTVPPSTWPIPSPRHPSMAGIDTTTTFPAPASDDGCLPGNVQRLPFRS
jgi:hypothetical protein